MYSRRFIIILHNVLYILDWRRSIQYVQYMQGNGWINKVQWVYNLCAAPLLLKIGRLPLDSLQWPNIICSPLRTHSPGFPVHTHSPLLSPMHTLTCALLCTHTHLCSPVHTHTLTCALLYTHTHTHLCSPVHTLTWYLYVLWVETWLEGHQPRGILL